MRGEGEGKGGAGEAGRGDDEMHCLPASRSASHDAITGSICREPPELTGTVNRCSELLAVIRR